MNDKLLLVVVHSERLMYKSLDYQTFRGKYFIKLAVKYKVNG